VAHLLEKGMTFANEFLEKAMGIQDDTRRAFFGKQQRSRIASSEGIKRAF
jgi:hypothetical protein